MTAPWSVRPILPGGKRYPASAVEVFADDATGREAVVQLVRLLDVGVWDQLRAAVERMDNEETRDWGRAEFDDLLDGVCREQNDPDILTRLWAVRVGAGEGLQFLDAVLRAFHPQVTQIGGAA